jgi:hypothetical protein
MCTIMTVSRELWQSDAPRLVQRIIDDASYNFDGWNLLCLDASNPDNDMQLSTMKVDAIPRIIDHFFDESSEHSRVFLHARAATTFCVGIAYNHGFTDHHGRIIMHNGVISNPNKLAVDSFNLANEYGLSSADALLSDLAFRGETFANIFVIDPQQTSYSVVRMIAGQLHTDGRGNYSTNAVGAINKSVEHYSAADHLLGESEIDWEEEDNDNFFTNSRRA